VLIVTARSLAIDQRAVDAAQTNVSKDQAIVNTEEAYLAVTCGSDLSSNPCQTGNSATTLEKDEANLSTAQFKLQVAQDRLKKDEGVTRSSTSIVHTPTTQSANCGALPVGPGAGPPPAACPGLP
jgi:hypothetical protein